MYDHAGVVSKYILTFSRYYANENPSILLEYANKLKLHISVVRQAGEQLGTAPDLLEKHDRSKWSRAEFFDYAVKFHSDTDNDDEFRAAWLHHIHHNPHHWQHWLIPGNPIPVRMPDVYADEMMADWLGAGYAYTGDWLNINEWLYDHVSKITLHPLTAGYVRETLIYAGYGVDAFKVYDFKSRLWP